MSTNKLYYESNMNILRALILVTAAFQTLIMVDHYLGRFARFLSAAASAY